MTTGTLDLELDDTPIPEAVIEYDAEYHRAEPDVGIMHGSWGATCEIISWRIGGLHLTRDQLVLAIGESAVCALEENQQERAAQDAADEAESAALDRGDWLYEQRRERGWAAE